MKIYNTHTEVYIIIMIVSCNPELIVIIKFTEKTTQRFTLLFYQSDFLQPNPIPPVWVDMQCHVCSCISVLSRRLNLLCIEVCLTRVLKGVYRDEVECGSVTPTVLTVTEVCRLTGHGKYQSGVC